MNTCIGLMTISGATETIRREGAYPDDAFSSMLISVFRDRFYLVLMVILLMSVGVYFVSMIAFLIASAIRRKRHMGQTFLLNVFSSLLVVFVFLVPLFLLVSCLGRIPPAGNFTKVDTAIAVAHFIAILLSVGLVCLVVVISHIGFRLSDRLCPACGKFFALLPSVVIHKEYDKKEDYLVVTKSRWCRFCEHVAIEKEYVPCEPAIPSIDPYGI